jgi:hypothetical protein
VLTRPIPTGAILTLSGAAGASEILQRGVGGTVDERVEAIVGVLTLSSTTYGRGGHGVETDRISCIACPSTTSETRGRHPTALTVHRSANTGRV